MIWQGTNFFGLYAALGLLSLVLVLSCVPWYLVKLSQLRTGGRFQDFSACWGLSWAAGLLLLSSGVWRFVEIELAHSYVPQAALVWHLALMQMSAWMVFGLVWMAWILAGSPSARFLPLWTVAWLPTGFVLLLTLRSAFSLGSWDKAPRLTGRELANLSLVPSPEELAFTGTVHQLLGVLIVLLSLWVWLERWGGVRYVRKASWGPILLVCAGAFLFFFGDFQAWPLDDVKPLSDFEVFAKKLLGLALGLSGFALSALADREELQAWPGQRILACCALLASAVLLTSTQTSAPYSQQAITMYFYHGLLALLCAFGGTIKMLETRTQTSSNLSHMAWCSSVTAVGILLLFSPWGTRL